VLLNLLVPSPLLPVGEHCRLTLGKIGLHREVRLGQVDRRFVAVLFLLSHLICQYPPRIRGIRMHLHYQRVEVGEMLLLAQL
jgi:hypothetical protein